MLYRLVRPMRRKGSQNAYFQQRIPTDVKPLAAGLKLALPVGDEFVIVPVSTGSRFVKVSLRTADPTEAKIWQARIAAHLEDTWRNLRAAAPMRLTQMQATALAGELYAGWANGERRERTRSMVRIPAKDAVPGEPVTEWKWIPDDEDLLDGEPALWEAASTYLAKVTELDSRYSAKDDPEGKRRPLEVAFGPIVDELLSRKGIPED